MYIATRDMKSYAEQRNGDAMVCQGIIRLMGTVAMMPGQFWGELPWSDEWRRGWATSASWRQDEAVRARDVLLDTSDKLLQAIADFTGEDQAAATEISLSGDLAEGMRPYLNGDARDDLRYRIGSYRPGGDGRYDPRDPTRGDPLRPPPGTQRPELGVGPPGGGPVDNYTRPPADGYDDALWRAMKAHGQFFKVIEEIARELDPKVEKFYSDYLLPAFRTRPVQIDRYADEVLLASRAYGDLVGDLERQNNKLPEYWTGHAGTAFREHVDTVRGYLAACVTEAATLGRGGKGAAVALRKLRDGYASVIWSQEPLLRNAYEDHTEFFEALGGGLVAIIARDPLSAAERLLTVVKVTTGELRKKRDSVRAVAADVIRDGDVAYSIPDFDSKEYLPRPLPSNDAPSADDWRHREDWDDRSGR